MFGVLCTVLFCFCWLLGIVYVWIYSLLPTNWIALFDCLFVLLSLVCVWLPYYVWLLTFCVWVWLSLSCWFWLIAGITFEFCCALVDGFVVEWFCWCVTLTLSLGLLVLFWFPLLYFLTSASFVLIICCWWCCCVFLWLLICGLIRLGVG